MKALVFLIFVLVELAFCSAREVPITILHTTDLHATILPTTDYNGTTNVGGVARCAWMIKKIRAEEKNVLLVDAGDLYQGNAIGYLTQGSVMTRTLQALQYDSWTLGNHEFDWGISKIAARLKETKVPVLAANLHHHSTADDPASITEAFKKVRPYLIRKVDGVKIGIVGLTTPGIPNWSRPRLIPGITLEDSVSALRRVIPQMKADRCQVLVLVTHQGIHESGDDHANQLLEVSRSFPELDVIIGGHTHRLYRQQFIKNILYTQANYWGTYLGRVDFVFDTDQQKLISRKADAIEMNADVPMDPDLLALLKTDIDRTEILLDTRVGEAAESIYARAPPRGPNKETPMFNLLCAAIAEAVQQRGGKVEAVLHGILNERAILKPGPITMRDIFEVVPYENTIGVARFTRDQLLEVLEENALTHYSPRFRGLWGMTMQLKPSAPEGKRVIFLGDREGKPIASDAYLWVAINSYDLASGGTRWKKLRQIVDDPKTELKEYDFQTRDAVTEYIRRHSPLKAELHQWWKVVRKQTSKETPEASEP